MKTAISLPDELFLRADTFARRTGRTRSQLYADALREFLARWDEADVTAALDLVCREVDSSLPEEYAANARELLAGEDW
ncbi:MAG TPA: hypothetical protein QGF58_08080 [Myxococcota bacterium]|nr:hypothetical protein [Myxococcota bacterium]